MSRFLITLLLLCSELWAQNTFWALDSEQAPSALSLEAVIAQALQQNERLEQNQTQIQSQQGLFKQSLGTLLPTLNGQLFWRHELGSGAGLSLRAPLLNVSGVLRTQSAASNLKAARNQYQRQRDTLVFDVSTLYINALLEQHLLALAHKQHAVSQERLESQKRRKILQETSNLDFKRAELLATRTEAQIVAKEASLRLALGQLADALGQNLNVSLQDLPALPSLEEEGRENLIAKAQKGRSDLRAQNESLHAAWLVKNSALWLFAPSLEAGFGLDLNFGKPEVWRAELLLSIPFFDGNIRYGTLDLAKATYRQEAAKKHLLLRELELGVQGSLVDIGQHKKLLDIQKQLLAIAESSVTSAENRYNAGLATSLDVLDEQMRLFEAQNEVEILTTKLYLSRLRLAYWLGDPFQNG